MRRTFFLIGVLCVCVMPVFAQQYTLIETMPGVGDAGEVKTFPDYITGLYNFALAFVIIAALLMITVGGFYYIISAGNQAQAGTAKKIITDAFIGLAVVFVTWLVLNTINPDLLSTTPDMSELRATPGFSQEATKSIVGPTGTGNAASNHATPKTITSVVGTDGRKYASEQECREANNPTCKSTQDYFKDNQQYLQQTLPDGSTRYIEAQNADACTESGAICMSGAAIKKQEMYNTASEQKTIDALNTVGINSANTAGLGKHTQETLDAAVAVAKDACGAQGCSGMRVVGSAKDGAQTMVLTYGDPQKDAIFINNVGKSAILTQDTIDQLPKNPSVGTTAHAYRTYVYPEGHAQAGQIVTHTVTKEYHDTNGWLPGGGEWRDVNSQITIFAQKRGAPTQSDDVGPRDDFALDDPFASF